MKPIHIIAIGSFGEEIAHRFYQKDNTVIITKINESSIFLPSDFFPSARLHILASWKPHQRLSKELDNLFSMWKEPWLPIIQEHPYLRIGPLVAYNEGACYHCFESRYFQQSLNAKHLKALYDYYDKHPEAGPKGYLPGFVGLAVSFVQTMVAKLDHNDLTIAGSIFQMNMLNRSSYSSKVVSIHGCPRCGLKRSEETRSVDLLTKSIKPILNERIEVNSQ